MSSSVTLGTAMMIGAGVSAAGGIASSVIQANAAKSAANTEAAAQEQAIAVQQQDFNTVTAEEQPYMNAGNAAAAQLQGLVAGTTSPQQILAANPGYQFAKQQGMQGVINGSAGGSGALSGATQAALISQNQGVAQQAYQNYYNQLMGVATLGQNAASRTGTNQTALAGQTSQSLASIGAAQAAGQIGVANAASAGLGSITGAANNYLTLGALTGQFPQASSGGALQSTYSGPTGSITMNGVQGLMDPYGNFTPYDGPS